MWKRYRTSTGNRFTMRCCEDAVMERVLFRVVRIALPLVTGILLTIVWLKGG